MTIIDGLFLINSLLAVTLAILMIVQKNPIYSALCLIGIFFPLAVIFLLLWAPFIAIIQILVYAGAIMVLFVFVIMMIHLEKRELEIEKGKYFKIGSAFLAVVFIGTAIFSALKATTFGKAPEGTIEEGFGSTAAIGRLIFDKYLIQFELVSVLILVALIGAVYLAKKRLD